MLESTPPWRVVSEPVVPNLWVPKPNAFWGMAISPNRVKSQHSARAVSWNEPKEFVRRESTFFVRHSVRSVCVCVRANNLAAQAGVGVSVVSAEKKARRDAHCVIGRHW